MKDARMTDLSRRSFVGGSLAFAAACSVPLPAQAFEERAVPAGRFFDSVGICTHPNWRSRLWGSTDWESAFLETGVMHTRGKIGRARAGEGAVADLQKLFARGVRICATVADQDEGLDRASTKANIDFLADRVGARNLAGIESANEYNQPRKSPPGWAAELRDFQRWLHATVRADPRLAGVPVVGPSIWGRLTADYIALGNLEPSVDKANLHYYTGGRRPTEAGRPSAGGEGGGAGEYSLSAAIREARMIAPNKPLWITEYGYPVAGPDLPPSRHFISEAAASKYLIRGLLDAFAEGVERTYIYTLVDDVHRSPPRYHGLMDGGLRPRSSFHAVRNLMALFADRGGRSAPGVLNYGVSNAAGSIKRQLFQKSDGTFLLTMYQDVDSFDRRTARDIAPAPVRVGLDLARPAARIEVFAPTMGASAQQTARNVKTIAVPVADHVTVVRITPQ
jgi:hypothetical protein